MTAVLTRFTWSPRKTCGLLSLALAATMGAERTHAEIVRFQFTIPKPTGGADVKTVDVRLFQTAMPRTVTNFLNYVDDNDWDNSFIHRRSALADSGVGVVQGGGYRLPASGIFEATQVPADPGIPDEPGGGVAGPSNLQGTIAMAKSGPNTAANEWYFNYIDNTFLDEPTPETGGFSAFGRILGNGMDVINQIVALPRINAGSPFNTVPVGSVSKVQAQQNIFPEDAVIVNDVRRLNVPAGDYNLDGKVDGVDLSMWKSNLGSTSKAEADGNGNGVVDGADFLIWQRTLGQNFGTPTVSAVPEPAAAVLLLLAAAGLKAAGRQ